MRLATSGEHPTMASISTDITVRLPHSAATCSGVSAHRGVVAERAASRACSPLNSPLMVASVDLIVARSLAQNVWSSSCATRCSSVPGARC